MEMQYMHILIKTLTCKLLFIILPSIYISAIFNKLLIYSYSLLGTTMVLAVKYYEEICLVNDKGERFYFDSQFQTAVNIPKPYLIDFQLIFLQTVDFELYISEE